MARLVAPNVLSDLARQTRSGVISVTGTNGKSTTAGLLSSILRDAGLDIVHNLQGANLVTGITASLVDAVSWDGVLDADYCLFEIDEGALPVVAREVSIDTVIVTNLFRDQLDRFGELDTTRKLIERGINFNKSKTILNADDPNVSQLATDSTKLFFGIDSIKSIAKSPDMPQDESLFNPVSNAELAYCSNCGSEVIYSSVYYGQLGIWRCSKCEHGAANRLQRCRRTTRC